MKLLLLIFLIVFCLLGDLTFSYENGPNKRTLKFQGVLWYIIYCIKNTSEKKYVILFEKN